jgi:hypothetical protein
MSIFKSYKSRFRQKSTASSLSSVSHENRQIKMKTYTEIPFSRNRFLYNLDIYKKMDAAKTIINP